MTPMFKVPPELDDPDVPPEDELQAARTTVAEAAAASTAQRRDRPKSAHICSLRHHSGAFAKRGLLNIGVSLRTVKKHTQAGARGCCGYPWFGLRKRPSASRFSSCRF